MYQFPIGVILDSFRKDTKAAIAEAVNIRAQGLQMYVTQGENSFENLVGEKRRELLKLVKGNGLCFSALCGDFGQGFGHRELNPVLLEKSKRMLDMAKELECNILTTHIGVLPEDKSNERYKIMQEACYELASYADSVEAHFAIETGGERSAVLKEFLDDFHSRGMAVNLDPANLIMGFGEDPVVAVHNLKDYIVHTHAKDGIKLKDTNVDYIFHAEPIPAGWVESDYCIEVPLGEGSVRFPSYLAALDEVGYRGFLTIERECGDDPTADIHTAADFLRRIMQN